MYVGGRGVDELRMVGEAIQVLSRLRVFEIVYNTMV